MLLRCGHVVSLGGAVHSERPHVEYADMLVRLARSGISAVPHPTPCPPPAMRFLLMWREDWSPGRTVRRVVGVADEEVEEQVEDFQYVGWHVCVLWMGCNDFIV